MEDVVRFPGRGRTVVAEAREQGVVVCIVKVDKVTAETAASGVDEPHEGGVEFSWGWGFHVVFEIVE